MGTEKRKKYFKYDKNSVVNNNLNNHLSQES